MNYAMIEYMAQKKALPHWAAEAGANEHQRAPAPAPIPLSDRILAWWLRRNAWRLIHSRTG